MSGNGKIMCNHGVNLFKCQACIDALVAEQIEKQEQRTIDLEQQLKTAKHDAVIQAANVVDSLSSESIEALFEYANSLEGK